MPTVDIIIRMIDQTGSASNSTIAKMKKMATELATVTAVVVGVGLAMKKAFALGKEGAMLEFTTTKFDRLAQSIGTTSDVLLRDLKKATGGIYSDMELMASATDFAALGLAKTHDEAVRLAAVSGGLNMNMNQLVLTLTNMTTMRFDALGVSVDGFKEKVAELEKQGYSTNDAFKEAFLQQAEMQLGKVGNAADTTLGVYMRFEAQLEDSTDAMKKNAGEGLAPLVGWLTDTMQAEERARTVLMAVNKDLYNQYQLLHQLTPEMQKIINEYTRAEQYGLAWEKVLQSNGTVITEVTVDLETLTETNRAFLSTLGQVQSAEEKYNDTTNSLTEERMKLEEEKQKLLNQGWWEQSEKILEINDKLEENSQKAQENADEHELANRRIILGLLERKLMQDGILDDKELQWLLEKGVAWGVYTDTIVTETKAAIDEANRLIDGLITEKTFTLSLNAMYGNYGDAARPSGAGSRRAHGGPVNANQPYMVGELGPELFAPSTSGSIVPNDRLPDRSQNNADIVRAIQSTKLNERKLARIIKTAVQRE